jgi:uncharacterized RDD family membrane protein YckC
MGADWAMMTPGLIAIAVTVMHVAISEALTGRSLGKVLLGLRVTDLKGNRPTARQALIRNALKTFDLIAYLLLILPIVSPYRQRLGDMVAQTVVASKAAPPPPED